MLFFFAAIEVAHNTTETHQSNIYKCRPKWLIDAVYYTHTFYIYIYMNEN